MPNANHNIVAFADYTPSSDDHICRTGAVVYSLQVQIFELMIHINQAKPDQTKPNVVRLWFDSGSLLLQFGKL
ncbi:hypothetical protein SDJN02_12245, partial [Cucurbita argyrosperma subsp. argyrosperma]